MFGTTVLFGTLCAADKGPINAADAAAGSLFSGAGTQSVSHSQMEIGLQPIISDHAAIEALRSHRDFILLSATEQERLLQVVSALFLWRTQLINNEQQNNVVLYHYYVTDVFPVVLRTRLLAYIVLYNVISEHTVLFIPELSEHVDGQGKAVLERYWRDKLAEMRNAIQLAQAERCRCAIL